MTMTLPTGEYLILNRQTGQALDFNIGAANQVSHEHPRVFFYAPTPQAPNHHWFVEQSGNSYVIQNKQRTHALDGNTNVPQHPATPYPAPFLYPTHPQAPNHRWQLIPATQGGNSFLIVNESSGLALCHESSLQQHQHFDAQHPSPVLIPSNPNDPQSQWVFLPVPSVTTTTVVETTTTTTTVNPFANSLPVSQLTLVNNLPTGNYMIVNRGTGLCLDGNFGAVKNVISKNHPRIILYTPNEKSKNHIWHIQNMSNNRINGEYVISSPYAGKKVLDGSIHNGVPQYDPMFPTPFLTGSVNHEQGKLMQRWKLYSAPNGAPGDFLIVNVATGKSLDGNNQLTSTHMDDKHISPFMWDPIAHASNHHWNLVPTKGGSGLGSIAGGALVGGLLLGGPVGLVIGAAVASASHNSAQRKQQRQLEDAQRQGSQSVVLEPMLMSSEHYYPNQVVPHTTTTTTTTTTAMPVPTVSVPPPQPEVVMMPPPQPIQPVVEQTYSAPLPEPIQPPVQPVQPVQPPVQVPVVTVVAQPEIVPEPVQVHVQVQPQQPSTFQTKASSFMSSLGNMMSNIKVSAEQSQSYQEPPSQQPYHQQYPHSANIQLNMGGVTATGVAYPHQPNMYPQVSVQPMDYNSFQGLLDALKRESFEDGRKQMISSAAAHNYFTCEQLSQIFKVCSFSSERSHAAQLIVPRIVDPQNSHVVTSVLSFSDEKQEVADLFLKPRHF